MKFMSRTAGCRLLNHGRDDILEEIKVDPVEKKLPQVMPAAWKTLDTQNNSVIIDLSEDEGLDESREYPKPSGLAAWRENCKWYSSLPLGAVVSLFCVSI
jgi:hypothetical protein